MGFFVSETNGGWSVDLSTRIDLVERVSFNELQERWASDLTLPKNLALSKVKDGALRAQFYGYLVESGPGVAKRYGNSEHTTTGMREPEWLTLQPKMAYRFLSGTRFAMPLRVELGYPAKSLLVESTLPPLGNNCHFHLVTEMRNLFEPGKIEILTEDIIRAEQELFSVPRKDSDATFDPSPILSTELRGNNLRVQINILEAALITLVERIGDGTASEYLHKSNRHSGLNVTKLSQEIDDHRHLYHALKSEGADGSAPRGASLENIQKVLTDAKNQLVSKNTTKPTPRKKT
jgi:hypothetical protein